MPGGNAQNPDRPPLRRPGGGPAVSLDAPDRKGQGREDPRGSQTWRVRDAGIQCIAAPCPTYVATRVDASGTTEELQIHEVELSALSKRDRERVQSEMLKGPGAPLEGRLRTIPNRGPAGDAVVLVVERLGTSR